MFTKEQIEQIKKETADANMSEEEIQEYFKPFDNEPSIEQRIEEMKEQDEIDNDATYTEEEYLLFAVEEYVANHEDYIEMNKENN